jgi:hypothetical protein
MVCHLAFKEVLKTKITITVMLRDLFWIQCMHGTYIADGKHVTSPSLFSTCFLKLLNTLLLQTVQERYLNCVSYNKSYMKVHHFLSKEPYQSGVFMSTTFTLRTALFRTLKTGPIGCPDTSVRNYCYLVYNNPEECSFYLLRRGSLKSRNLYVV